MLHLVLQLKMRITKDRLAVRKRCECNPSFQSLSNWPILSSPILMIRSVSNLKIITTKLNWNAKSKIGSLENKDHKPGMCDSTQNNPLP